MRPSLITAIGAVFLAGCATAESDVSVASSHPPVTDEARASDGQNGGVSPFEVDSFGLSFTLPTAFAKIEDPDFVFLARSLDPRAVFSVLEDSPDVTDHDPDPGELVSVLDLGGIDAVVVSDAVLDGLPPGIGANELLVANGSRSFSVIMSAAEADLPELWEAFISSVAVTPAD